MGNIAQLDSRLRFTRVTHPTLPLERTFCVNCGKPKGWVSVDSYDFIQANSIIVVCNDCEAALGEVPLIKADIEEI